MGFRRMSYTRDYDGLGSIEVARSLGVFPSLKLPIGGDVLGTVAAGDGLTLKVVSANAFKVRYASNLTTVTGGDVSGDDLRIKGNTTDTYPYIDLEGNSSIVIDTKDEVQIEVQNVQKAKIGLAGTGGALWLAEGTTPTAVGGYGAIYTKNDNKLYFQDGAGVEHEVAFVP